MEQVRNMAVSRTNILVELHDKSAKKLARELLDATPKVSRGSRVQYSFNTEVPPSFDIDVFCAAELLPNVWTVSGVI